MPNNSNVHSPITLVGNGRSGTSLVSQVFKFHPDFVYVGETSNLIHSVYKSMVASLPPNRHKDVGECIRVLFNQLFVTTEKYWFHKPIGIPIVKNYWKNEDEFINWYWNVFDRVFPGGKYFTCLRHPLDILISSQNWWNIPIQAVVKSNMLMAKLLTHPASKIKYAVVFEKLIANPEEETKNLFSHLNIEYHENCLRAFEKGWVMSLEGEGGQQTEEQMLEEKRKRAFSKKEKWAKINPSVLTDEYKKAIEDCWSKFGHTFGGWEAQL